MNSSTRRTGNRQISFFTGNRHKSVLNTRDIDELVARLRSLSSIEIITGPSAKFILGDDKSILVLPESNSSKTFMNYRGRWNRDNLYGSSFTVGDVVWVDHTPDGPVNEQTTRIQASSGSGAVQFNFNGQAFQSEYLVFRNEWLIICKADVTPTHDMVLQFDDPGHNSTPTFASYDQDFWDLLCITNPLIDLTPP